MGAGFEVGRASELAGPERAERTEGVGGRRFRDIRKRDFGDEFEGGGIDRAGRFAGERRALVAEGGAGGEARPVGAGRHRGGGRRRFSGDRPDVGLRERPVVDAEVGDERIGGAGGVRAADEKAVDRGAVDGGGRGGGFGEGVADRRIHVAQVAAAFAVHEELDASGPPGEGDVRPGAGERDAFAAGVAVLGVALVGAQAGVLPPEPQRPGADAAFVDAVRHRRGEEGAEGLRGRAEVPFALGPQRDRSAFARQVAGGGVGEAGSAGHPQGAGAGERPFAPVEAFGDERRGIAGGEGRHGRSVERRVEEEIRGVDGA